MEQIVESMSKALQDGGTVLYPTDTIWGIGCDAGNASAIEKIYAIKRRDRSKSMLVLATEDMVDFEGHDAWHDLFVGERPTTVILPAAEWRRMLRANVADNLLAEDGSLGIRLPQHALCQAVMRRAGCMLVSTSANLSGRPSPASYEDIDEELRRRVDYCVPPLRELMSAEHCGSRIVRLEADGGVTVIRP